MTHGSLPTHWRLRTRSLFLTGLEQIRPFASPVNSGIPQRRARCYIEVIFPCESGSGEPTSSDAVSIRSFLTSNALPGSVIITDGWKGYSKTALAGYRHELHDPETHALHIHRAFGNLKTWLNGTHHGVDPKYLQHYLGEICFPL